MYSGLSCLHAAVYTYNLTVDLNSAEVPSRYLLSDEWLLPLGQTINLTSGDTVQGTISFAGNQKLQFTGGLGLNSSGIALRLESPNNAASTTITTTLNGVNGTLSVPNPITSSSQSDGLIDVAEALIMTPTAQGTVSITGFSYSAQITSGGGDTYLADLTASYTGSGSIKVSVIPESTSYSTDAGLFGIVISLFSLSLPRSRLVNTR